MDLGVFLFKPIIGSSPVGESCNHGSFAAHEPQDPQAPFASLQLKQPGDCHAMLMHVCICETYIDTRLHVHTYVWVDVAVGQKWVPQIEPGK